MTLLSDAYDHKTREKHWQTYWLSQGVYEWKDDQPRAQTFVIDTPPPTVSGLLHMGHIFSYTQADFIARYQRMKGMDVFYPMGFDDNGLPTERLVEKTKKVRATDMSREEFIALCMGVSEEARQEFRHLFQSTALSVDWRQEYHTISEESRRISQLSFLDLFRKGEVYRKLQPMLWDPVDQTAIAQAEVEDKELPSHFSDILFEVVDGDFNPSSSGRGLGEGKTVILERILVNARRLRKDATDAEKLLWNILRNRQIGGLKFRRQHPMDAYIADFFCHEAKLVIELDGGQHNAEEMQAKDASRTTFMEQQGYRVLRFWNQEVLNNIEGVVAQLMEALTPTLSQGEREFIVIGTTRPELIPACVAVFYQPDDERYQHLQGKYAITPLFGVKVPILTDDTVEPEKGTGIMMCCTFGDEKDIEKWRKHDLPTRVVLNKYGKMDFTTSPTGRGRNDSVISGEGSLPHDESSPHPNPLPEGEGAYAALQNLKVSNTDAKHSGARQKILAMLQESGDLIESRPITHAVKCAERSGAPLEILPTYQWFVKVLDKKEALKEKAAECNWHPEWMKIRMDQWIDGLNWDWCISRQRYFGVPFPVWYVKDQSSESSGQELRIIVATPDQLPVNPLVSPPAGYTRIEHGTVYGEDLREAAPNSYYAVDENGKTCLITPEADVMDTWATSSVSPQLSSKGINRSALSSSGLNPSAPSSSGLTRGSGGEGQDPRVKPEDDSARGKDDETGSGADAPRDDEYPPLVLNPDRHAKLFPADLRPQAHEIIRTWAFYTLVKAHLHENTIPWKNLMISGWCLAADKTKMSKSKGNVVTPVELIEEKGTDAVRYWASTSRLGADTAFSEDLLKIGRKLVTKLWNAGKLSATLLEAIEGTPTTAAQDAAKGIITETLDQWLLAKLRIAIEKATESFERYEYADARAAIEDWFWNDFCDNYLELVKARAYGNDTKASQQSALYAIHHALNTVLRLFAPFVPHITEELFSSLFASDFAEEKSLHARGMWPKAADFHVGSQDVIVAGSNCISLLNAIRKKKSEENNSIKVLIKTLIIARAGITSDNYFKPMLESIEFDLKSAGNVVDIQYSDSAPPNSFHTADGSFTLNCSYANQTDAA